MTTSDQFLLAADLCHTVAQRFEREGKSNGGVQDSEGRVCVMRALGHARGKHLPGLPVDLALFALVEAPAGPSSLLRIPSWSDSSPTQVVIDCLRVAEKSLLRKADGDV